MPTIKTPSKLAWRITGWEPETQNEYIIGVFFADTRDEAIAIASKENPKNFVLDAYVIGVAK